MKSRGHSSFELSIVPQRPKARLCPLSKFDTGEFLRPIYRHWTLVTLPSCTHSPLTKSSCGEAEKTAPLEPARKSLSRHTESNTLLAKHTTRPTDTLPSFWFEKEGAALEGEKDPLLVSSERERDAPSFALFARRVKKDAGQRRDLRGGCPRCSRHPSRRRTRTEAANRRAARRPRAAQHDKKNLSLSLSHSPFPKTRKTQASLVRESLPRNKRGRRANAAVADRERAALDLRVSQSTQHPLSGYSSILHSPATYISPALHKSRDHTLFLTTARHLPKAENRPGTLCCRLAAPRYRAALFGIVGLRVSRRKYNNNKRQEKKSATTTTTQLCHETRERARARARARKTEGKIHTGFSIRRQIPRAQFAALKARLRRSSKESALFAAKATSFEPSSCVQVSLSLSLSFVHPTRRRCVSR